MFVVHSSQPNAQPLAQPAAQPKVLRIQNNTSVLMYKFKCFSLYFLKIIT